MCLVAILGAAVYGQAGRPTADGAGLSRAAPPRQPAARGLEGQAGEKVAILGSWSGTILESFWAAVEPFSQRTRTAVSFESTPDVARVLAGRLDEGAAPDIAILPSVALAERYARAGCLVPMRRVLDVDRVAAGYPAGWPDLASVDGEPYGLLYRATNESLVWYRPAEFQHRGWAVPTTWSELVALSERIASLGLSPWSLGLKSRAVDGAAGTDWIESILLRTAGPEVYDRWVRHEIPWTDPALVQAFLRWGQIVGRPRQLSGGVAGALATDPDEAALPIYLELPTAYLCLAGSAAQPLIAQRFPRQAVGRDYDFFPLPPLAVGAEAPIVAGADVLVVFRETPQVAALVDYLASVEAQAVWAGRGGFIALSPAVDPASYPDPLSRRAARELFDSRVLRFDASAQMPPEVELAFCRAVCEYTANPGRLEAILQEVEGVAREAYARQQE